MVEHIKKLEVERDSMTKKLLVTSENVEMVNGILKNFGYDSNLRFVNGREYGGLDTNGNHVRLSYDGHSGFYVSTTGKWMQDSYTIREYAMELLEVERLMNILEANILKDSQ